VESDPEAKDGGNPRRLATAKLSRRRADDQSNGSTEQSEDEGRGTLVRANIDFPITDGGFRITSSSNSASLSRFQGRTTKNGGQNAHRSRAKAACILAKKINAKVN